MPPTQLSINVNVNSRTQDSNLLTPLLMAVQSAAASANPFNGDEAGAPEDIIVRNLLLAGASVTARNISEQGEAKPFRHGLKTHIYLKLPLSTLYIFKVNIFYP